MAQVLQLRRGTTAQNDIFTGAAAEVSVDIDRKSLRVHDGSTMGGKEIADLETAIPLLPAAASVVTADEIPVIQSGVARRATKTQILDGIVDANIDAAADISGTKLADAAITTAKLDDEAVTTAKIDDSAVTTAKLDDEAVTTAKLDDEAVTTAKLDDEAVTTAKLDDEAVTTAKILDANVTPVKLAQPYTFSTSVFSTGGLAIDFTPIPSWARRITVMFNEVSTSGTSALLIQLGTAGGIENTGYVSTGMQVSTATASTGNSTDGFVIRSILAANVVSGVYTFYLINPISYSWVGSGAFKASTVITSFSSGSKSLSDALTRLRITTVNGTDTFDAGSINISYEG